jgi:hypothetical protein
MKATRSESRLLVSTSVQVSFAYLRKPWRLHRKVGRLHHREVNVAEETVIEEIAVAVDEIAVEIAVVVDVIAGLGEINNC